MKVSAVFFCGVYRAFYGVLQRFETSFQQGAGFYAGLLRFMRVLRSFKVASIVLSPWRTDGVQELIVLTGVVYMFAQASTPVNHGF